MSDKNISNLHQFGRMIPRRVRMALGSFSPHFRDILMTWWRARLNIDPLFYKSALRGFRERYPETRES